MLPEAYKAGSGFLLMFASSVVSHSEYCSYKLCTDKAFERSYILTLKLIINLNFSCSNVCIYIF